MSPLKEIRPVTEREGLCLSFLNRRRGPKEPRRRDEESLLDRVMATIEESKSGVVALVFDGASRGRDAYEIQGKLRAVGKSAGIDLQMKTKDRPDETILYVRRFKESG